MIFESGPGRNGFSQGGTCIFAAVLGDTYTYLRKRREKNTSWFFTSLTIMVGPDSEDRQGLKRFFFSNSEDGCVVLMVCV